MTQPDARASNPGRFQSSRLSGLLVAAHPFPAVLNGFAGGLVHVVAAGRLSPTSLGVAASIALIHASIGTMNDWVGRDSDRLSNPDKPIVRGVVAPLEVLAASVLTGLAGLMGAWATHALPIGLAILLAGAAYNLALKGTLWSWAPYAVAIPSVAVWAFLAAGSTSPWIWASYAVGAAMAVALNLANTLPDLEGDAALETAGLSHRLGERRSQMAAVTLLIVSSAGVAGPALGAALPAPGIAALAIGGIGAWVMAAGYRRGGRAALRRAWFACALSSVGLAACWAALLKGITEVVQ
ncbi:UbiA family prenyltransferase [Brevundimonas sp. Root1279]|uniref:UbiA family prenyltransferase n=1 Tax=Brevundimonas sp. Root1279 TaxID=1736443 RepID=UPI000B00786C|nr:UbiA family prenyltransferase [Brevundimonas sp. Root1279]